MPASAGSGAPAGSGLEVLPDFGAPAGTEGPVQTAASVDTGAPVQIRLPVETRAWTLNAVFVSQEQ